MYHVVAGRGVGTAMTSGEDSVGRDEGAAAGVAAEQPHGDLLGELTLVGILATDNALVGQTGHVVPGHGCKENQNVINFETWLLKLVNIDTTVLTRSCRNTESEESETHGYFLIEQVGLPCHYSS